MSASGFASGFSTVVTVSVDWKPPSLFGLVVVVAVVGAESVVDFGRTGFEDLAVGVTGRNVSGRVVVVVGAESVVDFGSTGCEGLVAGVTGRDASGRRGFRAGRIGADDKEEVGAAAEGACFASGVALDAAAILAFL